MDVDEENKNENGEGEQTERKYWGPAGLTDALTAALQPVADHEKDQTLEELVEFVQKSITRSGNKFAKDDRLKERGSPVDCQALIEEFIAAAMSNLGNACYDKVWLPDIDFTDALTAQARHSFKGTKIVTRTLATQLKKFVEDAIFRHKEEERIAKVMLEGLVHSGLNESFHKKTQKNLDFAFNEAHMAAAYGDTAAPSPEMGLVQDFVKFWMTEFAARSWDVLEQGVEGVQEDRYNFMSNLFNFLCAPERSILPQDIVGQLEAPPPENWPFIQEQAMLIMKELEDNPAKRQKLGGGGYEKKKGWGGGW